jgi:hypothetical protein
MGTNRFNVMTGFLLVALATLGAGCVGTPKNSTTVQEVEDKIRQRLPLGSSRADVMAWFKEQGIESHEGGKPVPMFTHGDKPTYATYIERSGLDPSSIGGVVSGVITDTKRDFGVNWSIQILFFLNEDGRTIKHQVSMQGTGL